LNPKGTIKNLRAPWVKGCPSPNPSGKPKRLPISDICAAFADLPIPDDARKILKRAGLPLDAGATFAHAVVLRLLMMALEGDLKAITEFRESIEGKTPQRPPEQEPEDKQLNIRVVYDKEEPKNSPVPKTNLELVPDKSSE
jgi:hypothetical protein